MASLTVHSFLLLLLHLSLCSLAVCWKLQANKAEVGSDADQTVKGKEDTKKEEPTNMSDADKDKDRIKLDKHLAEKLKELSQEPKKSVFSRMTKRGAATLTTVSNYIVTALTTGTFILEIMTLLKSIIKGKPTFSWKKIMEDKEFLAKVEKLKAKKAANIAGNASVGPLKKSMQLITQYWYLLLAVFIFISVCIIFYAKQGNTDREGEHTSESTPTQQQIRVIRMSHSKVKALKRKGRRRKVKVKGGTGKAAI